MALTKLADEPRTYAEIVARKKAADARMAEAARQAALKRLAAARIKAEQDRVANEAAVQAAMEEARKHLPPVKATIRRIALEHGVTPEDITGPRRLPHIVRARWEALAAVAAENPHFSLPKLAQHFGGRDHSTILHALRKVNGPGYKHRPTKYNSEEG